MMKKFYFHISLFLLVLLAACESAGDAAELGPQTGQGGSLARFTIGQDHLYIVTNQDLLVYSLDAQTYLEKQSEHNLGFGSETIFPYQDKLFIGTTTGMQIYDVSEPNNPQFLSSYAHVTSCDPVVVQDDFAYVTLRSGLTCAQGADQLDILDVSNPRAPQLRRSIPMDNPHGLGVSGQNLFICEGDFGLKYFSLPDPVRPSLLTHISDLQAQDVIIRDNLLIVTGDRGVNQYRFQNGQIEFLSKLY
ncbi:MAG: hypothetical protein AAFU64_09225 [Bacteroidota bacterium]